jgi:hypothetical protein
MIIGESEDCDDIITEGSNKFLHFRYSVRLVHPAAFVGTEVIEWLRTSMLNFEDGRYRCFADLIYFRDKQAVVAFLLRWGGILIHSKSYFSDTTNARLTRSD